MDSLQADAYQHTADISRMNDIESRLAAVERQLALLTKPVTYRGSPPDVEIFPGDQIRNAIHLTTEDARTLRQELSALGTRTRDGYKCPIVARLRDQLPR